MDQIQTTPDVTETVNDTLPQTPAGETPATEAETPEPNAPQTPPADVDYAKKFSDSAREAQILMEKNRRLEDRVRTLTTQDAPTESELQQRYPEWGQYNEFTKNVLSNQLVLERKNARLTDTVLEITDEQRQAMQFNRLVKQPKYAKLKEDAGFEEFTSSPKYKGMELEVLADAYLSRQGDGDITPPTTTPRTPRTEGLPRGSGGGQRAAAEQPQYSDEEVTAMMTKDPKKFRDLVKKGIIKIG
jgi:hypothetical protein